ncbi:hypothetical protein CFP56_039903 [Quercus suber]|uniref:Uncharacterized protein n=1 Tax=Quercus suber TaxID=58331 RepID=A0AAW0IZE5_QUESU
MPPGRGRIESEFPWVATDLQLSLNFRAWDKGRNDLSIYLLQPKNKKVI